MGSLSGLEGGPLYIVPFFRPVSRKHLGLDLPIRRETRSGALMANICSSTVPPRRIASLGMRADWWLVPLRWKSHRKRTGIFDALRGQGFSIGFASNSSPIAVERRFHNLRCRALETRSNAWRMPLSGDGQVRGPR